MMMVTIHGSMNFTLFLKITDNQKGMMKVAPEELLPGCIGPTSRHLFYSGIPARGSL
jgi:hypothetical protein